MPRTLFFTHILSATQEIKRDRRHSYRNFVVLWNSSIFYAVLSFSPIFHVFLRYDSSVRIAFPSKNLLRYFDFWPFLDAVEDSKGGGVNGLCSNSFRFLAYVVLPTLQFPNQEYGRECDLWWKSYSLFYSTKWPIFTRKIYSYWENEPNEQFMVCGKFLCISFI